ncbi:MAG: hypothetical protein ACREO0_15035, partial [Pseudoxanthomonas sp.]
LPEPFQIIKEGHKAYIDETWLQDALGALHATFKDVDDKMKTQMVQFLLDEGFWDAEKLDFPSAIARFNACCNPNKAEFFKMGEIWALMRRFNRHQLFHAMAHDLGYELRVIPTEERRQQLLQQLVDHTERLEYQLTAGRAAMERLMAAPVPGVKLVHAGQKVHFSMVDGQPTVVQRVGCP